MSAFSPAIRDFIAAPDDARRLGPYRCKELLDKAGSAPVYKAVEEHAGLSLRDVAIKIFDIGGARPTPGASADKWRARVVDQARTLCRVQHPNVIRFHTLTTDPKRGLIGLVMELAEGISVDRQLADLPPGDARRIALAVEIGINISAALAAAHDANVVHCNVKPSNIVFANGAHKLINFGIAATFEGDDSDKSEPRKLTVAAELPADTIGKKASTLDEKGPPIAGTLGYVDPVCLATTAPPNAASDLYSLGATLYQCLGNDLPARAGKSTVDAKVLLGESPPPSVADAAPPNTPADLVKLVDGLVAPARDARPRSADIVLRALERIRSQLSGRERALPSEERGPFPGLERYEDADRDVFFGRSAEIAGVLELARTRGLVGIVGLSGSGKSSLTRAGIVPAIEEGALGGWPTKYRSVLVTPGKDLMGALEKALEKILGAPLSTHPEAIAEDLAADVDAKGEGLVILVDQLEEVVTKFDEARADGRAKALELLSRLAEAHAGLRVVVAVRRDLLDGVLAIDAHFARALSRGIHLLGPLSSGAWEEVLDRSLEAYGYTFETPELRKEILGDIKNRESAMTLVQFGLSRLWAARDVKTQSIPRVAFSAKGGMRHALEEHADAAIAAKNVPKATVRDVLLALTTPEGTRTQVELDVLVKRFGDAAKDVVFALTKARIVVAEQDGFTFVHDSILREWSMLRGFIEDARDDRLLVAHVERDAGRWVASKDNAELWRKGRLAAAVDLWKAGTLPLSADARKFLAASAKEEQRAQMGKWGFALLVVAIVVGGSLFYAKQERDHAQRATNDAAALSAALEEVKSLKRQAEESAGEASAVAKLLRDMQNEMSAERNKTGASVAAALKKVTNATSIGDAQKATEDLQAAQAAPAPRAVVPLPADLGGPNIPKPVGDGPSAGGTFDQAAIERVVNSRKTAVKRVCLERNAGGAASTKVTATITIAPNGSVQNVSTAGDDPAVARCIEQQLRTWSFPAPGEVKTVQIPFVFVRQ